MTKEEIFNKNHHSFWDDNGNFHECLLRGDAFDAMSEYAKQQAIEFDIWKRQNGYLIDPGGEVYLKLIVEGDKARNEPVSADAVYNQFIESQNK
jgi:hypothetical protein